MPRSGDPSSEGSIADDWFDEVAEFLGAAYLRNAFTKGTDQEVEFLVGALELEPGARVLDVGCGPGRHSLALARRGIDVVGIDRSAAFLDLARAAAEAEHLDVEFVETDVRTLTDDQHFDVAICLCQGGFGLLGGHDEDAVFGRIVRSLRHGGRLALSAFSAAFALRHLEAGEQYDPSTGVLHELATVRDPSGAERGFDLWTTCFTAASCACWHARSMSRCMASSASRRGATPRRGRPSTIRSCCSSVGGAEARFTESAASR